MDRIIVKLTMIVLACVSTSTVFASIGGMEGGGGKGVVCRDSDGHIKSAEVLDLYEARVQYQLMIPVSTKPYMLQAIEAISPLKRTIVAFDYDAIVKSIYDIDRVKNVLPPGTKLQDVDDAFPVILPGKNCALEQFANYYNDSNILIDGEIWQALDAQGKAALVVHEAIYRFMRTYGAKNSQKARINVGHLFAQTSLEPTALMSDKNAIWRCGSKRVNANTKITEFYAEVDAKNRATIWFRILNNEYMFTATKLIDVPFWWGGSSGWYREGGRSFYFGNLTSKIDYGRNVNLSIESIVSDNVSEEKLKVDVGDRYSTPETEIICELANKPKA